MITHRGCIEGFRLEDWPNELRKFALRLGIKFTITHHSKGWFMETIYYEIEGERQKVAVFERTLDKHFEELEKASDSR